MTREEAARLLGIGHVTKPDGHTVRFAFAQQVRFNHPDTGSREDGADPVPMADLKKARDILLNLAPTDCPECRGTGWVSGQGFKQTRCRRGC